MRKKYIVKGMSCAACVGHVERAVKKLDGVENVNVSLLTNILTPIIADIRSNNPRYNNSNMFYCNFCNT